MNPNETIADRHQQYCVHYKRNPSLRGREACGAGVVYDELALVKELGINGSALRLPCLREHHESANRKGQPLCECHHLAWPTREECESHERDIKASIARTTAAMRIIGPIREQNRGKNWYGTLECPVCKGRLHVRHAACNGHVWARCETEGCVAWVE